MTNREGSAANSVDVLIPEEYKLAETGNTIMVLEKVYDLIDNYSERKQLFDEYRERIKTEKDCFETEVDNFLDIIG